METNNNCVKHIIEAITIERRLEELGFIKDEIITIVSKNGNNLIIKIRETKMAIGEDIALAIFVIPYVKEHQKVR